MRTLLTTAVIPTLLFLQLPGSALAQGDKGHEKDKAAIAKNADAFVDAFHKGDAKALAAFWLADGDYTDQTGKHLHGREAIEKAFQGFFADQKGLKLRIDSESLRFVTPDVAIEDGMTFVISPDGAPPSRARYTTVHVKKDGAWHISSVRDAAYSPPSNYEHLRELEWTIGNWADESTKGDVARISYDWADNQNFIAASFTTTFKNISIGGGTQRIGWDPAAKNLRSWTFEGNGSFGEGTWTRDGNKWLIKSTAVLKDGKTLHATNVLTHVDGDTMTWQATDVSVDGKKLPDTKKITMKRVK